MGTSKTQKARVNVICKCGCGEQFQAFPLYDRGRGHGLRTPEYKRGHHPNCRKAQRPKGQSPWNKGLSKRDNSSVAKQGVSGPTHWNHDPAKNPDWFADDFDYVKFSEDFGRKSRSKGGNKTYTKFRMAILRRDNFTCQECGLVADEFEETDLLNVHHIVFVKHDRTRIFDPSNVITLCYACHRKSHRRN